MPEEAPRRAVRLRARRPAEAREAATARRRRPLPGETGPCVDGALAADLAEDLRRGARHDNVVAAALDRALDRALEVAGRSVRRAVLVEEADR